MMDPEKLLRSARRIYGDQMDSLWGEFIPVPGHKLVIPRDGQEIMIGSLHFTAIDTPGHAEHHFAYLLGDLCFSGDVGGVRIPGYPYLRVPMPPPELHLEKWRASIGRLRRVKPRRIAPTHFGIFDDPAWQLQAMEETIDATRDWLQTSMRDDPDVDEVRSRFVRWMDEQARAQGLSAETVQSYDLANPPGMSADGLFRYWHKVRRPAEA
jgi:glyoxylase-like metal-dependent hydrolase (beta-lactamase superfamily II)